ncbi:MAG: DNA replication and repair protein RecF [Mariprofundaceae bacterium]
MATIPCLRLQEIYVESLRCHQKGMWRFSPGMNLITGANGCGKTTILEAISLMAHGRSFRAVRDPGLLRWGDEQFYLHGVWRRYGPVKVWVQGQHGQVKVKLQGRMVKKLSHLAHTLPVLIDAPQARRVVDGTASERRHWLDGLLMACHDNYIEYYRRYLRSLSQRSLLLRKRANAATQLDAWETQIVSHGRTIMRMRRDILAAMAPFLEAYARLMDAPLNVELLNSAPDDENAWLALLHARRDADAGKGGSRTGPHRDQLRILYRDKDIRQVGARGQQRLAAMVLRLAEWELHRHHKGLAPQLLLDDCLEALDPIRQQHLLECLHGTGAQVLLTAPNQVRVPAGLDIHVQQLVGHSIEEAA